MKKLLALGIALAGIAFILSRNNSTELYGNAALHYFLPVELSIFLIAYLLSERLGPILEQPPIMIFLLTMVIKMIASLIGFLIYLLNSLGPQNEGAAVFVVIYLIFEVLEIKRFLSILRPDSGIKTPE